MHNPALPSPSTPSAAVSGRDTPPPERWQRAAERRREHFAFLERLTRFAERRWPGFVERAEEDFAGNYYRTPGDDSLCAAFTLFEERYEGRSVFETFLSTHPELNEAETRVVEAERAAWLSWWEVLDADEQQGVRLRDLLNGTQRSVFDERAARSARRGMVMCGRVIDFDGVGLFSGAFPVGLPRADPRVEVMKSIAEELLGPNPAPATLRKDPVGILNCFRMLNGLLRPGVEPPAEALG